MGIYYKDHKEHTAYRNWKHGDSHKGDVKPLYRVWGNLKERCFNKKGRDYVYYGGKGVGMHRPWLDYKVFRAWAEATGYKVGLVMHRTKKHVGYYPHNIQWLTRSESAAGNNTRKRLLTWRQICTVRSSGLSSLKLAKVYNVSPTTILNIKNNKIYKKDLPDNE